MFKKRNLRTRHQQNFDRDNIKIKMAGKEINMAEWIQAGREDTEIYPVLEKYGCIDRIKKTTEELYIDVKAIQQLDGLRGIQTQAKEAKQMFEQLPIEVRKEFNNDVNKFTKEAPQFLMKLSEKIEREKQKTEVKTEVKTGEQNNVTE